MRKAALITGGGKRIGKEIALFLADQGYDIAIHYNHSESEAKEVAELIASKSVNCVTFQADLGNIKDTRTLVPRVTETYPNCSILVNNASIFDNICFGDVTEESFDKDFNINFKSPFFLSQDFSKHEGAELIINMLDTRVSKIETSHFIYNITKKALRDFTLMAAKELGPKIRVNGICPGPILPPQGGDENYLREMAKELPLKREGNPKYIVSAVKYFIENPYVTGECLFVDGGQHLN